MKSVTKKPQSARNFVAKHARTFNKSNVMVDRKRESKKNGDYYDDEDCSNTEIEDSY